ncbi:MAG: hypothetical protein IJ747_00425 [Lachnospiraceae bacterium]|nr:hypothetical protein [Lachnospiraceae bacterium]
MMDLGDYPAAFNDYHMHLVCADDIGLAENCNTQLGLLLRVLAARGDRNQMEQLKNSGEFDHIDPDTSRAIAELADMPKLLEHVEKGEQSRKRQSRQEQEGDYSMCVAIDEMVQEGEKRGEKRGEQLGTDKVNRLNALLLENNRMEDLKRAVVDVAFQRKLFREFGL